jgi:hypothetical protein
MLEDTLESIVNFIKLNKHITVMATLLLGTEPLMMN